MIGKHITFMATVKLMNQDLIKLDQFDGSNFTWWQDELKFLLTVLKIFYILYPSLVLVSKITDEDIDNVRAES